MSPLSGADRIEIFDSILEQICQYSMFKREDLKILLEEWINEGYWWLPTDEELISLLAGSS